MKKAVIILSILVFVMNSCGGTSNKYEDKSLSMDSEENGQLSIDTAKNAILPYDSTNDTHRWAFRNCSQAALTNGDIKLSDSLLTICIKNYNLEEEKRYEEIFRAFPNHKIDKNGFVIEDLTRYRRQYLCVTNEKGEKEVFINFLCEEELLSWTWLKENPNEWKKDLILVDDGGNCFFKIFINLTTKTSYGFDVNGPEYRILLNDEELKEMKKMHRI